MSDVFAAGMAALFDDPNGAVDGVFTPEGGAAIPVRVVVSAPDDLMEVLDISLAEASVVVELQIAQVAEARSGDQLVIGAGPAAGSYVVHGKPQRDAHRLVWQAGLVEA